MKIDLTERLRPEDANGWRVTPTITIAEGDYVDDPSKFRDGEPGRVYGPARVKLWVSPAQKRLEVW